ncbi:RHS repeat-associated core domain-containing protein [Ralstonia wenshanensis]|uniref:RHS repeat-associated core domain-containing protein n=1 Tax=Ralstonia wenshanensis TaxID=2842456 RepID=UPI001E5B416B|nr:RHS repeat-associated core domain-containing protein [Ralstonia wenshanensis]
MSWAYQYDALGRRITKHAQAVYFEPLGAGSVYIHNEHARVNKELGCGFTLYGWDGDTLAWEARRDADIMRQGAYHPSPGSTRTTHYLYEPNSFVPIAQGVTHGMLPLHKQPAYADAEYDIDEDPLWQHEIQPTPFDSLAWYQCDHLGTPQELTDQTGEIAWSAHYKAWGAAQEVITDAARKAGIQNPLRFQGQYFDHETGLHYNRHRYYDPASGWFISKDPIGLAGGLNLHAYAPNPVEWIDPLGLARIYKDAPYHGTMDNAVKSRAPTDGQFALNNSVQVKENSPRRVGVDARNDEIVVMDKTRTHPNGDEEFHGHVRCWCDLHNDQQSALKKSGMVSGKGRIKR